MRIVSLTPSSTEVLFAIGAGDDIVSVTQHCDYSVEALRRERLGFWLHTHVAAIEALQPDLIVTSMFFPEELHNYSGRGTILHLEPTNLGGVLESILQLGRATGRYQTAQALVATMQRAFEDIRGNAPDRALQVYCEAGEKPPLHAGNWVPELVTVAGGLPIGGVHSRPSTLTSVDALQAADPDLMVFHWCDEDSLLGAERVRRRPYWSALRAVQSNAMTFLPGDLLNRPGPRLVDGVRQLQAALHAHQHVR